jgi:hypothetical protein
MYLKALGRLWLSGFSAETRASPLFVPPQVKSENLREASDNNKQTTPSQNL